MSKVPPDMFRRFPEAANRRRRSSTRASFRLVSGKRFLLGRGDAPRPSTSSITSPEIGSSERRRRSSAKTVSMPEICDLTLEAVGRTDDGRSCNGCAAGVGIAPR